MRGFLARAGRYGAEIASALRADLVLYAAVLIYVLAATVYVASNGRLGIVDYDIYAAGCTALVCIALPYAMLVLGAARIAFESKGRRSLAWRTLFSPRRVGRGFAGTLLVVVFLLAFLAMYNSVKTTFSADDFPFDPLVADIDRALHFGRAPAEWLSFLRFGWLLHAVEINYDAIWFPFWLWILYWFCVTPRAEALRVRFVLTFTLAWALIGSLVASTTVTAGPALYGLATGDHGRFAEMAGFLQSTPNNTAAMQSYLWSMHAAGTGGLASGISAFPSMHVAVTTVCALFLSEYDKRFRLPAWTYLGVICLSSVYLGWHYAVDGYAAILMAVGIYWALRAAPQLRRFRFRMGGRAPVPVGSEDAALP